MGKREKIAFLRGVWGTTDRDRGGGGRGRYRKSWDGWGCQGSLREYRDEGGGVVSHDSGETEKEGDL